MTDAIKSQIDAMSHIELCRVWRHAPVGDERLQGDAGSYFKERLSSFGGFTPEISKLIGW